MKIKTIGSRSSAILRIVFGAMWLVDASFKWNLGFINKFTSYLTMSAASQSTLAQAWVHVWVHGVGVNVYFFAVFVAIAETAIAVGLILGFFTEIAIYGGVAMVIVIWSTSQNFGVPYTPGTIGIVTVVVYEMVFALIWIDKCWRYYSFDSFIHKKLPFLYRHW